MTPEQLLDLLAVVLALGFGYFPGVKDWFGRQSLFVKMLVQAGVLFGVAAALFGLSCANLYDIFVCTGEGAWAAFVLFLQAFLLFNQGVYQSLVRLPAKLSATVRRYQAWKLLG
jgi:hypothetical protein